MILSKKLFQPLISTIIGLILSLMTISFPGILQAKPNIVPVEGVNYMISSTLIDNLKSLQGKKVTLTLDSGKVLTGIVKEIGNHLIHLEKLDGKEFFDALIRTEEISAIETRFRTMQR